MAVEEAAFVNEGGWWSSRAIHTRDILLRQLRRPAGTPVLVRRCRSSSLGRHLAVASFNADANDEDPFRDCAAVALRTRAASVLSSSRAAAVARSSV